MRPSRRIRSGMRCSARCCTSARRRRSARSCTARWARRSNGSVPRACRSPPRSSRCTSSAAASRWPRCATTPRRRKPRSLHFSPAECMSPHRARLALLDQAPEGTERNALEITLATLRGVSAFQLLGVGAGSKSAFQRAYALLAGVPQHPMRGLLLHGFGFVLCLRAEYAEALAVAERAEALSSATNDPVLAAGRVHRARPGAPAAGPAARGARMARARARARWSRSTSRPAEIFVADPQVDAAGLLGIQLLHLGLVEQARARLQQAHARARSCDSRWRGWSQSGATRFSRCAWATPSVSRRLPTRCRRSSTSSRSRMAGCVPWFRGWADARMGQPREGYRQDSRGVRRKHAARDAGGRQREPGVCRGGARARRRLGRSRRATPGSAAVRARARERVYLPQLFLMRGCDRPCAWRAPRRSRFGPAALAEARAQEAPWLELLALVELCEPKARQAEDRRGAGRTHRPAS